MYSKKYIGINLIAWHSNKLTGAGKYMQRLFYAMGEMDLRRYHFYIYLQKGIDERIFHIPKDCDYDIIRVPKLNNIILRALFEQTFFYLWIRKCDILFAPIYTNPLMGRWKNVITLHDIASFIYPVKYSRLKQYWINLSARYMVKYSDLIITVSENSRKDIINILNVDPEKIKVIYNFITSGEIIVKNDIYNPKKQIIFSKKGQPMNIEKPYFVTVASLQPHKNLLGLIKAFALFREEHLNYKLYIVGGAVYNYNILYNHVHKENLADAIIFTGYLDDIEVNKLYSCCEAVVYVSFYEGFGIPPLEGFYHGKVCIVSNTSSIPEVAGEAGIYADPYDIYSIKSAMEEFILNGEKYKVNIQKQILKFNPHTEIEKFFQIINSL